MCRTTWAGTEAARRGPRAPGEDRNRQDLWRSACHHWTLTHRDCASSPGADDAFAAAAEALGRAIAARGLRLVYGGGHVGLMGVLADAALTAGGEVHGVITRALEAKEVAHGGLTTLEVVEGMHERKAAMANRADAFITLPGGFGTLDEFFEAVTWTQLGVRSKPCGVLDVDGYCDPLRALLARVIDQRFVWPEHGGMILMASEPDALLDQLGAWEPVVVDKWVDRSQR